ncbi:hypothetical protein D9758_001699 [Tetrapyrgos nigripes]|uniref:UFSP1/2/DUB catalytic domain-containing protein n=1 Tax=Tetrapyrgos nigripes TaxID=182062 RepID=A0A8H5GXI7_9AGAR|nr:hypothetical protein D9758_001699 [Tetrapyrgos nigripes]
MSQSVRCQLCFMPLDDLSLNSRELHYETHFKGELQEASSSGLSSRPYGVLKPSPPTKQSGSFKAPPSPVRKKKWKSSLNWSEEGRDVFWYPSLQTPPPPNFTPGMIPLLKKALTKSHAKGTTRRAVLCYDRAIHVNRQNWDLTWGCGYRNFLMTCAALMDQQSQPMYFALLDGPISPGIRNLQRWIEVAWKDGFDKEGYEQLKKLVNTSKWIGTSDLCTAFVYRGIPTELIDIDLDDRGIAPLTDWIVQYFDGYRKASTSGATNINNALTGASPVRCTSLMPIIVQNNGHSRTVVGYELTKNSTVNLLVFDPSRVPSKQIRRAALSAFKSSSDPDSTTSDPPIKRRDSPLATSSKSNASSASNKRIKTGTGAGHHAASAKEENVEDDAAWVDEDDDDDVRPITVGDNEDDDEIVFVSETKASGPKKSTFSWKKGQEGEDPLFIDVLKFFRWENNRVKQKNKYQILYFPLTEPLTILDRMDRKVLRSERI